MEKLPQRGYNSGEKEELLPKYVQMHGVTPRRFVFAEFLVPSTGKICCKSCGICPSTHTQHRCYTDCLEALRSQEPRAQITADRSEMGHLFAAAGLEPVSLKRCWRGT